jgi:hypothetical protein
MLFGERLLFVHVWTEEGEAIGDKREVWKVRAGNASSRLQTDHTPAFQIEASASKENSSRKGWALRRVSACNLERLTANDATGETARKYTPHYRGIWASFTL